MNTDYTTLKHKPGDILSYHFCGGTGYAFVNAYKWYIPRKETRYNKLQIVYLCTKLYGLNHPYGIYQSKGYQQEGWQDIPASSYYYDKPDQVEERGWPPGKEPAYTPVTKVFLPVYAQDITGTVNFTDSTVSRKTRFYDFKTNKFINDIRQVENKFYYFDKKKLINILDINKVGTKQQLEQRDSYLKRFKERKKAVLLSKLGA